MSIPHGLELKQHVKETFVVFFIHVWQTELVRSALFESLVVFMADGCISCRPRGTTFGKFVSYRHERVKHVDVFCSVATV